MDTLITPEERIKHMNVYKLLIVVGCQRSGTTLLASMLGRHPEICMINEPDKTEVFKLLGKTYQAGKFTTPRDIRLNERGNRFGHIVNCIINFDNPFSKHRRFQYKRWLPSNSLCLEDYIGRGAKIITITRNKNDVVTSMVKRIGYKREVAMEEYDHAIWTILKLNKLDATLTFNYNKLVATPEDHMRRACKHLQLTYDSCMLEGSKFNTRYPRDTIGGCNE